MGAEFGGIINGVIKTLNNSSQTSWSSGDLNQWADHAKRMRESIYNNVEVLKNLANVVDSYEKEMRRLQDRNDKLEEIILTKIINSVESGK